MEIKIQVKQPEYEKPRVIKEGALKDLTANGTPF